MAASLTIAEERGTYVRCPHPHNGYYAGDFSDRKDRAATLSGSSARQLRLTFLESLIATAH